MLLLVVVSALAAPQFNSNNAPDSAASPVSASSPELAASPGSAASPGFSAPENQPQQANPFGTSVSWLTFRCRVHYTFHDLAGVTEGIQIGLHQGIGSIISSAFGNLASSFSGWKEWKPTGVTINIPKILISCTGSHIFLCVYMYCIDYGNANKISIQTCLKD